MPVRPSVRRVAMVTAALVGGAGLAAFASAPAFAVPVTDEASLNAAILADEPTLELTADITLTADLELIDYDVTIVGNGHTVDADGFDAFHIAGSATVADLTVVDASEDGIWVSLAADQTASLTSVSTVGVGLAGIRGNISDSSSLTIIGGTHTDAGFGIEIDAFDAATTTITGVTVTDAEHGLDLEGTGTAAFTVSGATLTAGPNFNAGYAGTGAHLDLEGASTATVDDVTIASSTDPADGAFFYGVETLQYGANPIDFSGLTVTGGYYGMYVDVYEPEGSFSLVDSSVSGSAHHGVYLCDMAGTAVISGAEITANGFGDPGAALHIYNYGGTPVTVVDSTITGNGNIGLQLYSYDSGTSLTIVDSTISDNNGDGMLLELRDDSTASVVSSTSSDNIDGGLQVDLQQDSSVSVVDSTFAGNGWAGIEAFAYDESSLTVERSTASGNNEGGIWTWLYENSSAAVVNSTVSGNLAGSQGWGLWAGGEAGPEFRLAHSTVTENLGWAGAGFEDVTVSVTHSIIAGNDVSEEYGDLWIDSSPGTDVTVEWSLLGEVVDDSNGAAYTEGPGVTSGVADPGLEPLADNGGPTLTHLVSPSSPALNGGNPAILGAPDVDQRGGERIVGAAIDLGAVEVIPTLPATGSDLTSTTLIATLLLLLGAATAAATRLRRRAA